MTPDQLERKLIAIQQSTRTTLPFFARAHNFLRMKNKWYYNWHTSNFATKTHLVIFAVYIMTLPVVIYSLIKVPALYAEEPVTTTSADGTTTTRQAVYEDTADGVDLAEETLTDAFPNLERILPDVSIDLASSSGAIASTKVLKQVITVSDDQTGETNYKLDSGVEVTTKYEPSNNKTMGKNGESVKQTVILKNPTNSTITTDLDIAHTIAATTFSWDGKEYAATAQGQTFTPYESDVTVDPKSPVDAKQFEGISEAERKELPKIQRKVTKGLAFAFKAKNNDGKDATFTYDASDLKDANPTFTLKQDNGKTKLTVHLNAVTVGAKSEKILDPTYSMSTSTNWNVKLMRTGSSWLGTVNEIVDFNNDGKMDLLVGDSNAGFNSRAYSGSVYLIDNAIITSIAGTGQPLDLGTSANWTARIDGAAANQYLGWNILTFGDVNNDGVSDLLLQASTSFNSRSSSGSVYAVGGSTLTALAGTGTTIDLNNSSNYLFRIDGTTAGYDLGDNGVRIADLNNNGVEDLSIIETNGSASNVLIIYDSILTGFTGSIDLATTTNYTLKITGPTGGGLGYFAGHNYYDLNGDGKLDFAAAAPYTDFNTRTNSGSVYVLYNSLFGDYAGTGNTISLNTSTSYNIRFEGARASSYVAFADDYANAVLMKDLNGDGLGDLVFGSDLIQEDATYKGHVYVLYNQVFGGLAGTGNTVDMNTSSKWNLRIDGAAASDFVSQGGLRALDYNNDGKQDLAIASEYIRVTGNAFDNGGLYIVDNSKLGSSATTGATLSLATSDNYLVFFSGTNDVDEAFAGWGYNFGSISTSSSSDLFVSGAEASRAYVIYNFPHSVATTSLGATVSSALQTVTGTVTATSSSVTTVSDVQYKLDSNTPGSGWTSCAASDGSFNSLVETYSCSVNLGSVGAHTVYIRAKDTNGVYTAQSRYGSVSTTYSAATPTPTPTPTTTPTATPTPTPAASPTITPTPTSTPTVEPTQSPTLEPTATPSPESTAPYETEIKKTEAGELIISVYKMLVTDYFGKPLANTTVTLHSDPQTVTTDDYGVATFENVSLGNHTITYVSSNNVTFSRKLSITIPEAQKAQALESGTIITTLDPVVVSFPVGKPLLMPIIFAVIVIMVICSVLALILWKKRHHIH